MDDQNKNLILASALSFAVILVWFVLFPPEQTTQDPGATTETVTETVRADSGGQAPATAAADSGAGTDAVAATAADAVRVAIDSPSLSGSISTEGGRIDTLSLKDYRETIEPGSANVNLLTPVGSDNPYFVLFGWAPGGTLELSDVPGSSSEWQIAAGDTLSPGNPVELVWTNGAGLTFRRTMSVDDKFMFTVTQTVKNATGATVRLAPEARIERIGEPANLEGFFVLHEGAIRQGDEKRDYLKYKALRGFDRESAWTYGSNIADAATVNGGGWLGFTDHYWMTMLVPETSDAYQSVLQYDTARDTYRAIARLATVEVGPGASVSATTRVYAGAKEWATIRDYQDEGGIGQFIDSIDWGWYFFLTKPIFAVLHFLNGLIGNMGWSIILLTLVIKAILFPLAYKSYSSMAKMKKLQPQMEKLRERAGDDRQKLQQEMMAMYKREKVNPASGCLPLILQIPIFFSLYKVIFVTLELRHAPWIGWIHDLSSPDPTSILNLFGLFSWAPPDVSSVFHIFSLGVLPILLGISMWLQQKLNPAPTDATQAMIFAWLPWVFMFMLGRFASGLVIYWIANNTITFTQQYIIMRIQGQKPEIFSNIASGFRRKKAGGK